jgi:hypothetical protein
VLGAGALGAGVPKALEPLGERLGMLGMET